MILTSSWTSWIWLTPMLLEAERLRHETCSSNWNKPKQRAGILAASDSIPSTLRWVRRSALSPGWKKPTGKDQNPWSISGAGPDSIIGLLTVVSPISFTEWGFRCHETSSTLWSIRGGLAQLSRAQAGKANQASG